jgi:surface antigen
MNTLARVVVLGCMLLGSAAQAQYLNMLGASPIAQFSDTDDKLYKAAIQQALAEGTDGAPIAWKNPQSPAAGVVTPKKTYVADGMKCRDLLIANTYKTLKGDAVYTFCQTADGQWKLLK